MIVADASVVATALLDNEADGPAVRARLRGERLAAPDLLDLEVLSVIRRLHAMGRVNEVRARQEIHDLTELNVERAPHRPLLRRCWELRHNLTPYDAAYVALAEASNATLLTADERLARAPGIDCRIELLAPSGA